MPHLFPDLPCTTAGVLQVRSAAKLNLFLEVTARRDDGFHELDTVMVRTSLSDILRFSLRSDSQIRLSMAQNTSELRAAVQPDSASGLSSGADRPDNAAGPSDFPLDDSNLIVKAARALQQHTGVRSGADISIVKQIPSQAGMGGGSGNAATTLRALSQLWHTQTPVETLHELAAALGSDVNFLLDGCRAGHCVGRGEQVRSAAVRGQFHGVVVVPTSGNSTGEIFRALTIPSGSEVRSSDEVRAALRSGNRSTVVQSLFNRLQQPAVQLNADIEHTQLMIRQLAGHVLLTGSGSGCFALARSAAQAQAWRKQLQHSVTGFCQVFRF